MALNARGKVMLGLALLMLTLSGCLSGNDQVKQFDTLYASLSGQQMVPVKTTTAGGYGQLQVSAAKHVTGFVQLSGVTATDVVIYAAPRGSNDTAIMPIASLSDQGGGRWEITDAPLSDGEHQAFLNEEFYFLVEASGGLIRGQLDTRVLAKNATLNGNQVVPPVSSTASATGILVVDVPTDIANGAVRMASGSPTPTDVKLYQGAANFNGSEIAALDQSSSDLDLWLLAPTPLGALQLSDFQVGNSYFEVSTNGTAEIRGQIQ